jgi:hypothetical protein
MKSCCCTVCMLGRHADQLFPFHIADVPFFLLDTASDANLNPCSAAHCCRPRAGPPLRGLGPLWRTGSCYNVQQRSVSIEQATDPCTQRCTHQCTHHVAAAAATQHCGTMPCRQEATLVFGCWNDIIKGKYRVGGAGPGRMAHCLNSMLERPLFGDKGVMADFATTVAPPDTYTLHVHGTFISIDEAVLNHNRDLYIRGHLEVSAALIALQMWHEDAVCNLH